MTKGELRKHYLEKRAALPEAVCADLALKLYHHFFAHMDLSFVRVLHTYLPIQKNNEPDTWMFVDRIRREFPHIRISIPRISTGNSLQNIFYEGPQQLEINSWGIPEPRQGVETPPEKIDLVIVPLLVADKIGNRVGYGKGYYDRFLKSCRPDCKRVGLSLFDLEDRIDGTTKEDVKLNLCVTPQGVVTY